MTTVLHITTTPISLDWLLGPQLEAFAKSGYDVVTASAPGAHAKAMAYRGIPHHEVPAFTRAFDLGADFGAVRQIKALLDEVQPDIVHTHNPKPGVIGRLVSRWSRVPIVVNTVHGLYAQPTDRFLRRASVYGAERLAAAHSDAELVQSAEDLDVLRSLGIPDERLHLLGNGIDLTEFSPSPASARKARCLRIQLGIPLTTPVVGMVGRLVREKGYDEFFQAVEILRDRLGSQQVEFVVLGPSECGPGAVDQRTIDRMAEDHGVHFLGERRDVSTVLSMFDVFALPSHREGFPRAAMEASAMGVPVIATDIRGCRQVVDHGETGLLVGARKPHHLAITIEHLLTSFDLRIRLGRAARAKAIAEFDQQSVIDKTLTVYSQLLERRGLPVPQPDQSLVESTPWYADSIDLVAREASNVIDIANDDAPIEARRS